MKSSFRRLPAIVLCVALTLSQVACKSTNLNRVGAVIVAAAQAYESQLKALLAQGAIDQRTFDRLDKKALAIVGQAQHLSDQLAAFGNVTPGDVPALLLQFADLTRFIQGALTDPAYSNAESPKLTNALKYLNYAIAVLSNAAIVVAALFPPTPGRDAGGSVKASKIKIDLPPMPK